MLINVIQFYHLSIQRTAQCLGCRVLEVYLFENQGLQGCEALQPGRYVKTFRINLLLSSSGQGEAVASSEISVRVHKVSLRVKLNCWSFASLTCHAYCIIFRSQSVWQALLHRKQLKYDSNYNLKKNCNRRIQILLYF